MKYHFFVPARKTYLLKFVIIHLLIRMGGRIHRRMATIHYLEPDGDMPRILPAMRWDPMTDSHTHMDVADALGPRLGMTADEFRDELERRTAFLSRLSTEGIRHVAQARQALAAYRRASLTR